MVCYILKRYVKIQAYELAGGCYLDETQILQSCLRENV